MITVVLLAGGLATRLNSVTVNTPKSMILIDDKPFIYYQLKLLAEKGITQVLICTGHLGDQIESFVGDGKDYGLDVSYSREGENLLGTGGALRKALFLLGSAFVVMYGDSYLDVDFKDICSYYYAQNKPGLMTIYRNDNLWDRSNVVYVGGNILAYDKNNLTSDMHFIDYGLAILNKKSIEPLITKDVFDLSEIYQKLIENNNMAGYVIGKRFYEIGSSEGISEMQDYIKQLKGEQVG
jgi:NDP-sugar pyrophosphorylase family protein